MGAQQKAGGQRNWKKCRDTMDGRPGDDENKSKQNPKTFQSQWALDAKSEFILGIYKNQRSSWSMALLWSSGFWIRFINFKSLWSRSGEDWRSANIGKNSSTTILTKNVQTWKNSIFDLGILPAWSCRGTLIWHLMNHFIIYAIYKSTIQLHNCTGAWANHKGANQEPLCISRPLVTHFRKLMKGQNNQRFQTCYLENIRTVKNLKIVP